MEKGEKMLMSVFYIVSSVICCLLMSFLFVRYILFMPASSSFKSIAFIFLMIIGCTPALVAYPVENILGKIYPAYVAVLYFLFTAAVILIALTIFTDFFWLLGKAFRLINIGPYTARAMPVNLFLAAMALICAGWAQYEGIKTPKIKEVILSSPKIKEERTLVLLSDLHINRLVSPERIKAIVARTNAQNPDIILLAGDVLDDDAEYIKPLTSLLKELKAKEGIFFVTGNHEFYVGYSASVKEIQELGFAFLENNGVSLNDVYIGGIPDFRAGRMFHKEARLKQAFQDSRPEQFKLLMSHTPADFNEKNVFDLQVSGHTHGGQIFPFHLFAALGNKYLAGLYDMKNGAQIYVSRGSGQWGPQLRFLAPSEITVLKLKPKKEDGSL